MTDPQRPRTEAGRVLLSLHDERRWLLRKDYEAAILQVEAEAASLAAPAGLREALERLNSLGIAGPNIIHAEQGMWPDGKHSVDDTWDGPGWCVCGRVWPCEAKRLGDLIAVLAAAPRSPDLRERIEAGEASPEIAARVERLLNYADPESGVDLVSRPAVLAILAAAPRSPEPTLRAALRGLLHANAKAAGQDPDGISAVVEAESIARRALAASPEIPEAAPALDVELLARCIDIEGYPWEDQRPPGWRNRKEAERIAGEYASLSSREEGERG